MAMSRIALAPLAAALALTAAPAAAQVAPGATYFTSSKTQAILGGESRLAAIMAQQSGQPMPQPAAYSPGYGAQIVQAKMSIYRPAISMDRPDVFNSVALPIGHTSLDRRWHKVANGPVGATSAAYASGLSGRSAIDRQGPWRKRPKWRRRGRWRPCASAGRARYGRPAAPPN